MAAPRVNIYGFPHKGLRNGLSQLMFQVSKTDVTSQASVAELKSLSSTLVELLDLHQQAEDSVVLKDLETRVPGSTTKNHADHDELYAKVAAFAAHIDGIEAGDSMAVTQQALDMVASFCSEYLMHMAEEEGEINEVIWAHFTDEEILQWQGQIMGKLTPDQKMDWFRFIVPALNPMERQIMLGGVKEVLPPEAYQGILNMLSNYMSADELAPLAA